MAQPVTPRPVGGETGRGGAAAAVFPPSRPGFLELQITADSLGELIMNRLRAETICAGQEFREEKNGPLEVVDHVEFHAPAVKPAVPHPQEQGPWQLQLKISATLFIKDKSALLDPATTEAVLHDPGIDLFFDVTSEDGELCIGFNTFHSVFSIPHDARQEILGALTSFSLCTPLDLSALPHVLGDLTAAKAKVGSDDGFTLLSVRLDLGAGEHAWRTFADAPVVSFLNGLDWAILIGSGLVVGVFEQMMPTNMHEPSDIAQSHGPSGKWSMSPFQISADNDEDVRRRRIGVDGGRRLERLMRHRLQRRRPGRAQRAGAQSGQDHHRLRIRPQLLGRLSLLRRGADRRHHRRPHRRHPRPGRRHALGLRAEEQPPAGLRLSGRAGRR